MVSADFVDIGAALGVGLLIGAERERRKGEAANRASAGLRTFTAASLAGAVAILAGGAPLLAVTTVAVSALAALAYWRNRDDDPGLTTEISLVLTVLLGGLCMRDPRLAAGVAVVVAVVLAARTPLHHFVRRVLNQSEVADALVFASATLVVLPLVPDRSMGPYAALNPHAIWIVVVLVLAIGGIGHIAVRWLGNRFGLPVAGLASGFVSSLATIGAMGAEARKTPGNLGPAAAGAVLSTLATTIQMAVVIGVVDIATLRALAAPLLGAGAGAMLYAAFVTLGALRRADAQQATAGRAFSIRTALTFAALLSGVMLATAALREWFGEAGLIAGAGLAGLVDAHAAAISTATLVASGRLTPDDAVLPILVGLSANSANKILFATAGGRAFAVRVVPGLVLVVAAAWLGALAPGLFGQR
ncbi:MgtC/SapB family protein [Phenylobacterium montanum]|uniref:DUF4010 domain-containing protein n=1 Tax=Phenylobacterium montanum TaxID=2823693 RepID=A0A975G323_9CAUL|nr:DUF4010 domain-containing protein [Caulobacter sp. S6]QUD89648.1 DUF4010 domain-containing protein [Caulobacter sp. S6]